MQVQEPPGSCPDQCPLESCLQLLAGAWTPNVLWRLRNGPQRFGELRRGLPGVSAKVLSTRLRELELRGVLARSVLPTSPPSVEYALTDLGRDLHPVLEAIASVGKRLRLRAKRSASARAAGRRVAGGRR
jgi:DNA-binding HxlR family transcriptional regulator